MYAQTTTHATLLARLNDAEDRSAWEEFCERYGELITRFAQREGLQLADCEDVAQDVLMALTRSMPGFEYDPRKGKFRSYLKAATLHAVFRKRHQRHGQVNLEHIAEATRVAVTDATIDESWEAEWRRYHLRQAMRTVEAEFNDTDRQAFHKYAIEGRDARDVAAELGLSLDQVYQAKSRIMKQLARVIECQVEEEG